MLFPDMKDSLHTAVLGSTGRYTTFSHAGRTLTFRTCAGLVRYLRVLRWDNGYLEVLAEYRQRPAPVEEYIDLVPVLERLRMDKDAFLSPIRNVRLAHA